MFTRPHSILKLSRSIVAACWLACGASTVCAAPQTMELFASGGVTTATGPTLTPQTNTYFLNTDNPTGNTQLAVAPALTVTYSMENQVFGGASPTATTAGITIGGTLPDGTNVTRYIPLVQQGTPANTGVENN